MSDETVYVVCVNLPGCLPEMEPYAVAGKDNAYDCARNELDDGDSLGYSRAEWSSALDAGGASVYLESGYVLEVTPLDSLGLDDEDRAAYLEQVS
jgi:hypothetical protein